MRKQTRDEAIETAELSKAEGATKSPMATAVSLLMMPPVSWSDVVESWQADGPGFGWFPQPEERPTMRESADALDRHIMQAARLRAYLYSRDAGLDHAAAVKASSRLVTKIRRALGYAYPKDDLSF